MAKTQARRPRAPTQVRVRERGNIYFAYRPRIDEQVARSLDDVERLYMILSPRGRDSYRLVVIGGKRLPAVNHTHLAYAPELPPEPGEVQRALNIVEEGSYIAAVNAA